MERRWIPADTGVPVWIPLLPLIAGMLFVGYLGVSSILDNYHLQTRGRPTEASVYTTHGSKGSTRVDAWFETADGHLVKARLKRFDFEDSEDEIRIEYDPLDPELAQQAGVGYNYLDGAFKLLLSGLSLWGIGFIIVASFTRRAE
ncbi:DUF3592 domain-containing protein [Kribbella sp. NPDC051620]|uniref:DUF3592 domain-containing protein n=1 Tax=Kribbella sp. NPDC051620 TaxID=3364120 RepID=UPI0037BA03D7